MFPNPIRNKLISDNVVQSTVHFQKRIEKMFSLMGYDFFGNGDDSYHAASYFFRVEFQQRGAPHIHSLLWLKNKSNNEAPNFWIEDQTTQEGQSEEHKVKVFEARIKEVEEFAGQLISTSADEMRCEKHETSKVGSNCNECRILQELVRKYQNIITHSHAQKKRKL